MSKKLINLSNLQKFLLKLNEKFALKKAMKGISEDAEGNIIIGEEGLVPTPNENSKGKFLRSDGEWALPSETAVYDSMTIEEGIAGVSEVDKVLNAKNLKQIVNSDGFLTSLDTSKLTGIINIENLPQGALERILIVSSKEERLTLLDTEVQLGDVVKESDTGLMYYVINTEKLNSEEGYTQFTAGMASSVPWSGVTDKPTIPTKLSDLTNDSDFAIDSDVVHKSGNEEISGSKTFLNGTWITNNQSTMGYSIKNIDLARNDVPTEYQHYTFRAYDKNNKILGEYCIEKSTNGDALLNMGVRSEDSSGTQIAYGMQFRMTNDGSLVRFMPSENNKVHLGDVGAKWASVHATNAHVTYTYTNRVTSYSIVHPSDTSYFFVSGGTDYDKGATLYLGGNSATNFTPGRFALAARKTDGTSVELAGSPNGTLTWGGKNVAIDENLVHRTGNETINGSKTFTETVTTLNGKTINGFFVKNSALARNDVPSEHHHFSFRAVDKNGEILGEYCIEKSTSGNLILNMNVRSQDANATQIAKGIQFIMGNDGSSPKLIPADNNNTDLGASSYKWKNVYATTFNGSLSGTIASSTTATTQAISDNSTKVATTEWVTNKLPQLVMCIGSAINITNGTIDGSGCYPVYQTEGGFQFNPNITLVDGTYKILSSCYPSYISGTSTTTKHYFLVTRIA